MNYLIINGSWLKGTRSGPWGRRTRGGRGVGGSVQMIRVVGKGGGGCPAPIFLDPINCEQPPNARATVPVLTNGKKENKLSVLLHSFLLSHGENSGFTKSIIPLR